MNRAVSNTSVLQSICGWRRQILNTAENCLHNISCRQQLQNISIWWKFEVLADKCNTEKTDIDIITIYVSYNDDIDIYIIRKKNNSNIIQKHLYNYEQP
jgi:hypothetical protein